MPAYSYTYSVRTWFDLVLVKGFDDLCAADLYARRCNKRAEALGLKVRYEATLIRA